MRLMNIAVSKFCSCEAIVLIKIRICHMDYFMMFFLA